MKGDFDEELCAARTTTAVGAVCDLEMPCEADCLHMACPSFISITMTDNSTKHYSREKGFILAHNSVFQSITVGKL